jgi:hypothetical protein
LDLLFKRDNCAAWLLWQTLLLTRFANRRIVPIIPEEGALTMSVMCSLAACKAQAGMCGHEKAMLSVALLAAIGFGAYFFMS